MENTVQTGNTVTAHYVGSLDDGSTFDSSRDRGEPLTTQVGAGQLIAGFESALVGMTVGETKTVTLGPSEAYGEYNENAIQEVPKAAFPENLPLAPGSPIYGQNPDGHTFPATVKEVREETVLVDMNHPMAGKNLNFEIELVSID